VKLVLEEAETEGLRTYLRERAPDVATSAVARVEVVRAARVADASGRAAANAAELLDGCTIVAVTAAVVRHATELASQRLRTLDALHLASADAVQPDAILVYDDRLAAAARERGLAVEQPGR
jgi:predicted nucleic acid-binding protein